jgi:hypothetical protein
MKIIACVAFKPATAARNARPFLGGLPNGSDSDLAASVKSRATASTPRN